VATRATTNKVTGDLATESFFDALAQTTLSQETADPTSNVVEGSVWARTDSDLLRMRIDGLTTNETIGGYGPWTAYTPVLSDAGGGGGAWAIGNGTLVGRWRYLSGRTVAIEIVMTCGTTTSGMGTGGAVLLSTPPGANIAAFARLNARVLDVGVAAYAAFGVQYSATQVSVTALLTTGTYAVETNVTGSVPMSFGVGDSIEIRGVYEAAA
jgi:hypothetical protein